MGHGGDTQLHGACAKYGEMTVDFTATQENKDFYDKEVFIDANNINVFREKVFFCFSCNSNKNNSKSLARLSKTYGIEAFVGFGNIPTDYIEGVPFSKRCIAIYKGKYLQPIITQYFATNKSEIWS